MLHEASKQSSHSSPVLSFPRSINVGDQGSPNLDVSCCSSTIIKGPCEQRVVARDDRFTANGRLAIVECKCAQRRHICAYASSAFEQPYSGRPRHWMPLPKFVHGDPGARTPKVFGVHSDSCCAWASLVTGDLVALQLVLI